MKSRIGNRSQRGKGRRKTALPLSNYTPELPLITLIWTPRYYRVSRRKQYLNVPVHFRRTWLRISRNTHGSTLEYP